MAANRFSISAWLMVCVALAPFEGLTRGPGVPQDHGATTNTLGISSIFGPDGKVTAEGLRFTTEAYNREAFKQVLQEANKVAQELHLPEKLPITEADVVRMFIVGYGMSHVYPKAIGNIHTRNYGYFVSVDHKLSNVVRTHYDQDCMKWREQYKWPVSRIDTNGAYQLAVQWLAAASMDVNALNRDCQVRARPNSFWNAPLAGKGTFVPIYEVSWISPQNIAEGVGCVANVSLFAPTKTLIDLSVYDSKYILRKSLVFTNLDALLAEPKSK